MSVIERWNRQHEGEGHYAAIAGFEADLKAKSESLELAYDDMDVYAQVALFGLVVDLLDEHRVSQDNEIKRLRAENKQWRESTVMLVGEEVVLQEDKTARLQALIVEAAAAMGEALKITEIDYHVERSFVATYIRLAAERDKIKESP